jgi:hypothetical protein
MRKEKTFGVLKFSALRHEVLMENEVGSTSEEIKIRTYDLKCSVQERMIQVSIPADVDWYIKADDIILKNKGNQPTENPKSHTLQGQSKK